MAQNRPPAFAKVGPAELTGQERAGLIAWRLAKGDRLTVVNVAQACGLSERGARALLYRLSRTLPIVCTQWGVWLEMAPRRND